MMMASSNENIFHVTDSFCGEISGHREIPLKEVARFYAWTNGWVNNRDAGDLRRHRSHYDVTVMLTSKNTYV